MPRIFRVLPEEGILHILTRGNNRQAIFHDDKDYKAYLDFITHYKKEDNIKVYHYCLMPNHTHLIIEITMTHLLPLFSIIQMVFYVSTCLLVYPDTENIHW